MSVVSADLQVYPSTYVPGAPGTITGGARTGSPITGATSGEIFPRLISLASGTMDVNTVVQYQKPFWYNNNASDDLSMAWAFLSNGLIRPSAANFIFIVLTNIGDVGKQVRLREVVTVSSVLVPASEYVLTPTAIGPSNAVSSINQPNWVVRAQLLDATSGAQVPAVGDVQIWCGSVIGSAVLLGVIPGPINSNSFSWATNEIQMAGVATLDDTGTTASNVTAPSGLTFGYFNSYTNGIPVVLDSTNTTNILTHGHGWGFWGLETLQPGFPSELVQYVWGIQGI